MSHRDVDWSAKDTFRQKTQSPTASGRGYNYKWRGQAFPPDIANWLHSECLEAHRITSAENKIATWLRSYDRNVTHDQFGLIVDNRRVDVQPMVKLMPRLVVKKWSPQAYILTNFQATECLLVSSNTSSQWTRHLIWHEFPVALAKYREVKIRIEILI